MKKIGFLGGSFDPIHLGHVHLAISLKEKCGLDEIIFSPAFLSPFKQETPPIASPEDRLKMLQLALGKIDGFRIDDGEMREKKVSYTIEALRRLQKASPGREWHLLMAEDMAEHLLEWKEIEEIFRLAPPLIGRRSGHFLKRKEIEKFFVEIPRLDISSVDIRGRLEKGLYCGHLLNANVLDYIYQNQLYSSIIYK